MDLKVGIDRILLLWYILLSLEVYGSRIEVFWGGLMGWDVRRAERDFIGWRFGVRGLMIFVVVFVFVVVVVVAFAPEWKRGEWRKRRGGRRKRREGKGRGEKRIGEERREEEGRQEKRRQERLHLYI